MRIPVSAMACGLLIANLYYLQPLTPFIAREMGWSEQATAMLVPISNAGYGLGLFFLLPLADFIASRRLIGAMMAAVSVSLFAISLSQDWYFMAFATLVLGVSASVMQVIVPVVAGLSNSAQSGKTLGYLVVGITVGIAMARPLASQVAAFSDWNSIFLLSSIALGLFTLLMIRVLPSASEATHPQRQGFLSTMLSQKMLWLRLPVLRQRAVAQGWVFGSFSAFWASVPIYLASDQFGFGYVEMSIFALVAFAGVPVALLSGRLADSRFKTQALGYSMGSLYLSAALASLSLVTSPFLAIFLLGLGAIVLEWSVNSHLVLSQRTIFDLSPSHRGRINSLFMASFYLGGSVGAAFSVFIYLRWGWQAVVAQLWFMALAANFFEKRLMPNHNPTDLQGTSA
jgi:predicted MFS family arabinose efflux permease